MQSRPTTDAILTDLAREVREEIMPLIDDPAVRVNLEMMDQLLTAAAVRSAHEIAWMNDEIADMTEFAQKVHDRTGDASLATFPSNRSPRFAVNAAISFAALNQLITQVSWVKPVTSTRAGTKASVGRTKQSKQEPKGVAELRRR